MADAIVNKIKSFLNWLLNFIKSIPVKLFDNRIYVVGVIVISIIIASLVYSNNIKKTFVEKKTSYLTVKYLDDENINFNDISNNKTYKKTIVIKNNTRMKVKYHVDISNLKNTITKGNLYYYITDEDNNILLNETGLPLSNTIIRSVSNLVIKEGEIKKIYINFYYKGKEKNKKIKGTINISDSELNKNYALSLKLQESILNSHSRIGKDIADSNEGLVQVGNRYYFRGKVENNYLTFAGYNFRIIGINSDNSIRIIASDNLNLVYNWNNNYEINNKTNKMLLFDYNNSKVKNILNRWLITRFSGDASNFLVPNYYCNELTKTNKTFNTMLKVEGKKDVTATCKNKIYTYVGLISVDELMISGATKEGNKDYYLYNNKSFWTMSPYQNGELNVAENYFMNSEDGSINHAIYINSLELKPVINLKADVNYSGEGTKSNPYVIK